MRFGVLGVVEAWIGGRSVELGHARQRCVLGVLLVEAGRPVTVDQLIDRVWGGSAPQRAAGALYSYLSRLRGAIAGADGVEVRREPGGYLLTVDPHAVDLHEFRDLSALARAAESDRAAADLFGRALELWRGEPFAGLDTPWLGATRRTLLGERFAAELDRNDVLLRLGRHAELLPALSAAIAEHPLDERLAGQAMLTLYRCGRQADADEQYRRIRRALADELGSDPGAALRRLHEQILAADPALDAAVAEPGGVVAAAAGTTPVPMQLPADVRAFTGRTEEIAALDRLLVAPGGAEPPLTVALLSGTAGVGKSALAVRWAQRVRDAFPDGQLYVNLRGYDTEQPVAVADALAGFLTALGVRGPEIPPGTDERAARYRSELTGRRMLVLLDNASSVEQVRPLLPGTGSCLVLVTSRDSLPGMVAVHGAERVNLDLLPLPDALGLLRKLIGARVDAEPAAARALAAACARLPLALRIAAELAAERADVPLAELVAELGDHRVRLDLLDAGGDPRAEVRAVFSWSYQNLPEAAARVFRLLGLHPGETAHVDAIAALTGVPAGEARRLLGVLTRASLVQAGRGGRYGMHDLLRVYAAELATGHDGETDRRAALTRLFDHYLTGAVAAMATLYPADAAAPGDPEAARAWIEAERPNLAAICTYGAAHGFHRHTIALAETLFRYLDAAGPVAEAATVTASAVSAARAIGDHGAQARALSHLGRLHRRQGRLHDAAATYRQALSRYAEVPDPAAEALVLRNLGSVDWRLGDYRQAADHYRRAWTLYEQLGDQAGQADALVRLGLVDARLGDHPQAVRRFEAALELYATLGDRFSEAYVLSLLARQPHHPAGLDRAAAHLEQSLGAVRRTGDRTAEAYALTDLAAVQARQGRLSEAAGQLRRALVLHRRIGDRASEAEALNDLGQVLRAAGDAVEARTQHGQALELAEEIGDRYETARAHHGLAAALHDTGDPAAAQPHHDRARQLFADLRVPAAPPVEQRQVRA
ncbi:DNA-binding SARP family transcriptional activator/tetratricopeptide (TPR) repeat protein [Actinoplanes octamycinicus]|uniref:DNA-binding SARP family transcriptional activator/tetratricopeptide (TPR) repeat protein n=1 Tax=Actinoplanes octamycinicus TaxID=135948 RepID=A0A7W7H353_9ACTN|nr:tetratricopeptide repeat protein [Actinoplanes octamycinicus]MBB4743063.1 DNA-binding SARP family transcriptional activator/tetratricopeptide (TPR) repeat protein [Actinoplanes octamycinicus]GIE61373.1 XRE family transcriptional regulator [Actinoplanes octamycinicus]